ncbi:hypothetical protein ZWY2020_037186 [Hordeum vulgare]|nr:hypothetical protein ZWY2020_037186 [Hordeum vulgare]
MEASPCTRATRGEVLGRQGAMTDLRRLSREAEDMLAELFASIDGGGGGAPNKNKEDAVRARPRVVQLRLSPELALWKSTQHASATCCPLRRGLIKPRREFSPSLGATDWPEAMKTTNALSGSGMANLLIGASDVRTLFSNYVVDMAFYYEHGYHKAFPSFSRLCDGIARPASEPRWRQRREAVAIGASYIRAKIALEAAHKTLLKDRSAQMDRRAAQLSGTDVADVGSDLVNSEVMNSFLNVADIAASGVVSEPALRAIYDAYAATGARINLRPRPALPQSKTKDQELLALWSSIVTGPLDVQEGEVDEQREKHLIESSRLQMVHLFSKGLIDEMVWLVAHASHHAWQVNYLFEAAMFGSILDGGALIGKLDRAEED